MMPQVLGPQRQEAAKPDPNLNVGCAMACCVIGSGWGSLPLGFRYLSPRVVVGVKGITEGKC